MGLEVLKENLGDEKFCSAAPREEKRDELLIVKLDLGMWAVLCRCVLQVVLLLVEESFAEEAPWGAASLRVAFALDDVCCCCRKLDRRTTAEMRFKES